MSISTKQTSIFKRFEPAYPFISEELAQKALDDFRKNHTKASGWLELNNKLIAQKDEDTGIMYYYVSAQFVQLNK